MSGRVTTPPPYRHPSPPTAVFLAVIGVLNAVSLIAAAEPPDDKSPRPPATPSPPVEAQKYQIPNKDRAIFRGFPHPKSGPPVNGIIDFEPIATEIKNKLEYDAWHEVLLHAAQFPAPELEEHARRDAIRDELVELPRTIEHYRLELLRFDGWVSKARRLPTTRSLRESGAGFAELYEILLVPFDEPPSDPVSFMFTELPAALASVKQSPPGEWQPVERWGVAAGYFFKAVRDTAAREAMPVLVGKSVRILDGPPAPLDPKRPATIDKNLRIFQSIRNNAPIATRAENWEEGAAWNRVLLHARRFSPEELEENARTDLTFFDLYNDGKWIDKDGRAHYDGPRDYQLDLVRFEGRLLSFKKMPPPRKLHDAGVETAYEGWLVPRDEPTGNPICIVFTDPIDGVEASGRVNKWVSFAGYVFKLLQYESGENDRDDPTRHKWKRAPLLLGRATLVRTDPEAASSVSWANFVIGAALGGILLLGTTIGLSWWFRRGDREARREIEETRIRNPFAEPAS